MKTLIQTKRISIIDENEVMKSAIELGRIHGRDNDWIPDSLEEAIEELESLGEGSPVSNGYEIQSSEIVTI